MNMYEALHCISPPDGLIGRDYLKVFSTLP